MMLGSTHSPFKTPSPQPTPQPDSQAAAPVEEAPVPAEPVQEASLPLKPALPYREPDLAAHEFVKYPSVTTTQLSEVQEGWSAADFARDAGTQRWADVVAEGTKNMVMSSIFDEVGLREGADFQEGVQTETGVLRISKATPKMAAGAVSPDKLKERIKLSFGLGASMGIPLWHSGFWVRMRAPTEAELLMVHQEVHSEKRVLGRSTYGLLYSSSRIHVVSPLVDLCMELIEETSLKLPEGQSLLEHIALTDLNWLLLGLTCVIWPNGYEYARACVADQSACKHVVTELISPMKLQKVDRSALTPWQKKHMCQRAKASVTLEAQQRYLDEFVSGHEREIALNDTVSVTLKVPTVHEHIVSSLKWVNAIEETYGAALTIDPEKRKEFILNQARATVLRNYTHFIKLISYRFDDGSHQLSDAELIEETLDELSSIEEVRIKLSEEIGKYIKDATIALVGLDDYECPNCGKTQVSLLDEKRFSKLIPIDVIPSFFTLVVQKLTKVTQR